jgi:hypothetical protein
MTLKENIQILGDEIADDYEFFEKNGLSVLAYCAPLRINMPTVV